MKLRLEHIILLLSAVQLLAAGKRQPPKEKYSFLAVLPTPARSHHRVWQPLLRELALRGHHVTLVSPIPLEEPPPNFHHINLGDGMEFLNKVMQIAGEDDSSFLKREGITKHFLLMRSLRNFGQALAEVTLETPEMRRLLESDQKFDGLILESSFVQESFIALQHRFQAPVIEIETCGNWHWGYWLHGNPLDTNYIVDSSVPYSDHMTLVEKIHNTVNSLTTRIQYLWNTDRIEGLMDKHIRYPGWESRPSLMDMLRNTSLVLVNTHHSLNYPFPMAPNFREVGGLNLVPVKPLPKDLQEFMDGGKDGVIYFTLGSFIEVSTMLGENLGPIFLKVFSRLKERVLMKWEKDLPGLPSNVRISKWFPQQDILAHKNMKMFISHGGFLSLTEAVNQGVPILGIPMMGDQEKNIGHAEKFQYGLGLQFKNITEASLTWAINEILQNPKYAENAKMRSQLFRDKPETALETAVYWTEYVIRHKGAHHLKPAISSMPWYQQAMIDVYSAIAAIILIPLYILYRVFKCICKRITGKKMTKKIKTK